MTKEQKDLANRYVDLLGHRINQNETKQKDTYARIGAGKDGCRLELELVYRQIEVQQTIAKGIALLASLLLAEQGEGDTSIPICFP